MTKITAERKEELAWNRTMANAKPYVSDKTFAAMCTPAAAGTHILDKLVRDVNERLERGQKEVADFTAKLGRDPARAFEWSANVFDAAGTVGACQQVLAIIAERPTDEYAAWSDLNVVKEVVRRLTDDVLRSAQYPERSTSAQSNEIARSLASAKAKLLVDFNMRLSYYA